MGSGASKSSKIQEKSTKPPVANVNKQENQKSPLDVNSKNSTTKKLDSKNDASSLNQIKTKDLNSSELINENNKQIKSKKITSDYDYNNKLQFEEDSEINDDIDEVLKIPTSHDNSKKPNKKDIKQLERNKENNYNNISTNVQQDFPETYAQRQQRKQYKLQQDILIREKTIIRNSKDWDYDDNDDDKNYEDTEMESPKKFDASKFRAANKEQKKDFPTLKDDMTTPRYFQPPDQTLDDIGVKKRDDTYLYKQAPNYDKDELDLMRQLEEELL